MSFDLRKEKYGKLLETEMAVRKAKAMNCSFNSYIEKWHIAVKNSIELGLL